MRPAAAGRQRSINENSFLPVSSAAAEFAVVESDQGRTPIADFIWQTSGVTLSGSSCDRVHDVSVNIRATSTALVGHSGAGKTSLLNLLVGMESPTHGHVLRTDAAATRFSLPLFWAPQDGGLWPHLTARQHLNAVVDSKSPISASGPREFSDELDNLLDAFDLHSRRHAFPGELSQGEQSRLAIARALAANPGILVLDEPLSHVDPMRRPQYWRLIREHVSRTGASLLFSTHEPDVAVRETEFVICMSSGRTIWQGPTRQLYHHPPQKRLGEFLGPINWFEETERQIWLEASNTDQPGIRPEQLRVEVDSDANIEILSFQFSGSYSETTLKHIPTSQTKTIIHRPPGEVLAAGQRVCLKVLV